MRSRLLRLFLKPVESLVAHELFKGMGEFTGIEVVVVGRRGLAVMMVEAVCHGDGEKEELHRRQLA